MCIYITISWEVKKPGQAKLAWEVKKPGQAKLAWEE